MRPVITSNPNMLRKLFSVYFWVTWAALTLASGLLLLEVFRAVHGEVQIVILPKRESASTASGNTLALLQSETFATLVTTELETEREDETVPRIDWSQTVEAVLLPFSSTLTIQVTTAERLMNERLLRLIVKELPLRLSQWYDVRTDIDLRLLDGPNYRVIVQSWPLFLLSSVTLAFVVTSIFFGSLLWLDRVARMRRSARKAEYRISPDTFRPSEAVPYWSHYQTEAQPILSPVQAIEPEPITPSEYIGESESTAPVIETLYRPEPLALESVFQETEIEHEVTPLNTSPEVASDPVPASQSTEPVATGRAPDNLPVLEVLSPLEAANALLFKSDIDETVRIQSAVAETILVEPGSPTASESQTAEPTQAEYKRRLNDLLSGKL